MNQVLKERVYCQGNDKWMHFMEKLTKMSPLERDYFERQCNGMTDDSVRADLGLTEKQFDKVEKSVSKKFLWGSLYCIDFTMRNDDSIQ